MFLNQTSHYALRAMTGLVISKTNKPVGSKKLAEVTSVPSHYLSKIMRKMVKAGYVDSRKGHGGGFTLKVSPDKLRIIDVLTASGFDVDEQPCVFGFDSCGDDNPCPLHPVWKQLKNCFTDWSHNTTLEDIRRESSKLEDVKRWVKE